jgi:hypothetical protein
VSEKRGSCQMEHGRIIDLYPPMTCLAEINNFHLEDHYPIPRDYLGLLARGARYFEPEFRIDL